MLVNRVICSRLIKLINKYGARNISLFIAIIYIKGREGMAREPDVALVITASGSQLNLS